MNFMTSNEKELEVVVTYKCNWNCSYCCVDTHNQPNVKLSELKEKLDKIKRDYKGWNITLSGGEVGMMSYSEITMILEELKDFNLSLNTNGLFLKKYPELIENFSDILYHASPEMADRNVMLNLPDNVQYMIVISDENLKNLKDFLEYYKDIIFHLVPASNPEGIHKPILSKQNKFKILKQFRQNATLESQLRLISEKKFDEIVYL